MKPFLVLLLPLFLLGCGSSEEAAIAAIERLRGNVTLDDVSGAVIQVDLHDPQITDAALVHLKDLTRLESLQVWDTQITDAGLKHLRVLASLKSLYLYDTMVTDAGLSQIKAALPKCGIHHGVQ
ncbi:MAG: hypothetical protein GY903_22455 [Fuerstiella sp.]|nr:hypothetical protein [Fuerstiella sp.]MCP4857254.1 hypothetical protein [Fuerstiella sp.]